VTPERLAEIKERLAAETHHLACFTADGMADGATCWSREYVGDVFALVAEVERLRSALTDIGKAAEERSNGLSGAWVFERVCAALGLPGSHSFWLTPEQQDAVIRRLQVAH
jgi:hypothetical protein